MDAPVGDVQSWGHASVRAWLASLGLASYAPLFAQHDITGLVLRDVTRPALRAMGIARVGDELRLAAAIAKLRMAPPVACAPPPPPPPPAPSHSDSDTGASRPPRPEPQPQWDDTIEVLAPDMAWMSPRPSAPPSRSRARSVSVSHSPDSHDPISVSAASASASGRARTPSTPLSSTPGSPASGAVDTPVGYELGDAGNSAGISFPSTRGGFSGLSSRRIGGRPPPLHLQQSSGGPPAGPALPPPVRVAVDPQMSRSQARRRRHVHTDSSASSGGSASGPSLVPPFRPTNQPAETRTRSHSLFRISNPVQGPTLAHPNLRSGPSAATGTPTPGTGLSLRHLPSSRPGSASGSHPLYPAPPNLLYGHSPPSGSAPLPWQQTPAQAQHYLPAGYAATPPTAASAGSADVPRTPTSAQEFAPWLEGERPPSSSGFRTYWRNPPSSSSSHNPTLEDLQRRTMKFVSADGASRMVNVSDCRDAAEVLGRVLRKFGVPAQGNGYAAPLYRDDEQDQVWRLAAPMANGETRLLEADELVGLCQNAPVTDRARGLLLVCLTPPSGRAGSVETLALPHSQDDTLVPFASRSPQTEPSEAELYLAPSPPQRAGFAASANPSPGAQGNASDADGPEYGSDGPAVRADASRRPRGMSKLEAFFGERTETLASSPQAPAKLKPRRKKTLNFFDLTPPLVPQVVPPGGVASSSPNPAFTGAPPRRRKHHLVGQRPPSELISSHLADFFPATEKRLLERTARRSLYRTSMVHRQSAAEDQDGERYPVPTIPPVPPSENWAQYLLRAAQTDTPPTAVPVLEPEPESESDVVTTPVPASGTVPDQTSAPSPGPAPGTASDSEPLPHQLPPLTLPPTLMPFPSMPLHVDAAPRDAGAYARARRVASYRSTHSDANSLLTVDEIRMEVEQRQSQEGEERGSASTTATRRSMDRRSLRSRSLRSSKSTRSSRSSRSRRTTKLPPTPVHGDHSAENKSIKSATLVQEEEDKSDAPACSASLSLDTTEEESEGDRTSVQGSDTDADADADEEEEEEEGDESTMDVSDDSDDSDDEGTGRIRWLKGALIGAGSFGNVFLGMNARTGVIMAVKQVELPPGYGQVSDGTDAGALEQGQATGAHARKVGQLRALEREIELLKTLKHPHIVQYLDSYADTTHLNIFLEYVPGGSVAALVSEYGAFSERLARRFIRQILSGLRFLHSRGIIHRDIKGANILVDTASTVKISDFGISKKVESVVSGVGGKANRASLQGSVFWMAPEVVKQTAYTSKADIWSLGCLLVEMLTGTHPWAALNQMQALFKIGSGGQHPGVPAHASAQATNFLQSAFELDYRARPTAATLLAHPWVAGTATTTGTTTTAATTTAAATPTAPPAPTPPPAQAPSSSPEDVAAPAAPAGPAP